MTRAIPQGLRIGWFTRASRLTRKGLAGVVSWFRDRPVARLRNRVRWRWLRAKMHIRRPQAFVLWHDTDHGPSTRDQKINGAEIKHFLFPDRLRIYFWLAGTAGALIFFSKAPDKNVSCLYTYMNDYLCNQAFNLNDYFLHSVFPGILIYTLVVYLAPYLIYILFRIRVLEQLSRQLPDKFARWMLVGVTESVTSTRSSKAGGRWQSIFGTLPMVLNWMTPFRSERGRLAVVYDGPNSRQGRLTRLAMAEFFNPKKVASEDVALSRWVFYGLAPLWVFVLLMTTAIIVAAITGGTLVGTRDLLLMDVAWVILAWIFFVAETPRMSRDLTIKLDDLALLPSQIARPSTNFASVITGQMFRLVLNAAVTIIAVVYATLSALVP